MFNEDAVFKPYGFKKEILLPLMKRQNLKGIILNLPENVYYTTCFTVLPSSGNPILHTIKNVFPFFVYISEAGEVTLICWGYSTFEVEFGADQIKGFTNYDDAPRTLATLLQENVNENDILGIESICPYYAVSMI